MSRECGHQIESAMTGKQILRDFHLSEMEGYEFIAQRLDTNGPIFSPSALGISASHKKWGASCLWAASLSCGSYGFP